MQIEKGAATALENAEDFNEAFPVRLAVAEKTLPRTSPAVLPDLELIKRAEAERALEAMARKIKREAQKREKGKEPVSTSLSRRLKDSSSRRCAKRPISFLAEASGIRARAA